VGEDNFWLHDGGPVPGGAESYGGPPPIPLDELRRHIPRGWKARRRWFVESRDGGFVMPTTIVEPREGQAFEYFPAMPRRLTEGFKTAMPEFPERVPKYQRILRTSRWGSGPEGLHDRRRGEHGGHRDGRGSGEPGGERLGAPDNAGPSGLAGAGRIRADLHQPEIEGAAIAVRVVDVISTRFLTAQRAPRGRYRSGAPDRAAERMATSLGPFAKVHVPAA